MKKILLVAACSMAVVFLAFPAAYSESETNNENLSLAKAIQKELPEVFPNGGASFAASGGMNFVKNSVAILPSAGVLTSNDLALNGPALVVSGAAGGNQGGSAPCTSVNCAHHQGSSNGTGNGP